MTVKGYKVFVYVLFIIGCTIPFKGVAQSYGLGFLSHETVLDKRTGLDLSPGKTLCFKNNFELSFDFAFLPDRDNYFGYIVRLVNDDNENIDLIYDRRLEGKHFKLIVGDRVSKISFDIDESRLLNRWTRFYFNFDINQQLLVFKFGNTTFKQHVALTGKNCFKVLFGTNDYLDFKTNDTPPMKLRDIKITENGSPRYHWPLKQSDGDTAKDELTGAVAKAVNPLWIKKLHSNWQPAQTFKIKGNASVAFDSHAETVYLVTTDSLISYNVALNSSQKTRYKTGSQYLLNGNQSYYADAAHQLFNINIDRKEVAGYDTAQRSWTLKHGTSFFETNYWHANKFYSPADSCVYIIGGYGQFFYKNEVQQYSLRTKKWRKIKVSGSKFIPRYLAALGATGQGAYILGGYGSLTGQQILNPKNLYDLLYFDVKKHSFTKIYDLKAPGEDFVFANSMVINEKEKSFYGLIFPKHKYNSNLQLVKGSLVKPELETLADQIPYTFHDIKSFADLFYCKKSKRFVAVTLFLTEKNETVINIYTLSSPPINPSKTAVKQAQQPNNIKYLFLGMFALVGVTIVLLIIKKHQVKRQNIAQNQVKPIVTSSVKPNEALDVKETLIRNTIYLFGDLQLIDREGNDLTKNLTPLTKELFLIILLYTIKWGRGITSEKLKEILWFDKSAESARNNRSVNIAKLKNLLDKMDGCTIAKESGHWKMVLDESVLHVDYKTYLDEVKGMIKPHKAAIEQLSAIIQRGNFLSDAEYEWLDGFKSEIANQIIDTYQQFAATISVKNEPELMIKVANYIFYFDPVNEEAMMQKCKSLMALGKHSLAKNTYDIFCKEYHTIYGENFDKDFQMVIDANMP